VGHLPKGLDFEPAAPILCAGVTVYKGLKETEAKPGDTVVISGIGGLGHVAVQYAKAMGLGVIAVDISDEKLSLARNMGADAAVNAMTSEAVAEDAPDMFDHAGGDLDQAPADGRELGTGGGCAVGIAARTRCISQYAAVWNTSRRNWRSRCGTTCDLMPAVPCAA
jgi:NADPH:quinone reductase-like Zn-dependent oxidoreductase